jgi:hypothetical protein
MADDNVTFDMPEGFSPPENLASDNTFQAMATFKVTSDNELRLVDIDGYQVGEGEEAEEEGAGPSATQTEAANAAAAVGGGGGGPAIGGGPPAGPPGNMSADRMPAGAPPDRIGGFAEAMGQKFKKATAAARPRK